MVLSDEAAGTTRVNEGTQSPRVETPARPRTTNTLAPLQARHAELKSEHGQTRIADGVVAKIAGMATREIPGVQSMGKSLARTFGSLRARVPGATEDDVSTQGVSVEVGERQAAIDLDIVTYYGQSIVEIAEAVRRNVIERIEGMTGLEVTEVNVNVDDLFVEGDHAEQRSPARVQ
jgi:uncharacterized alkaline shock family protein YloU